MPRSKQAIKKVSAADSESPNKRQTRSQTKELICAFENFDIEHADKLILHRGIDPSVINPKILKRTLRLAVKMRNTSLVRELLKYQPNLDTDDEPMLMSAIKQFNVEIAMMLIKAGVNVNEDKYLHTIVSCDDPRMHELVVPLLEHGAYVEARDQHDKSILYYAVKKEALVIVEELLRRGVQIHDDEFQEILKIAATSPKAAQFLVLFSEYNCISLETRDTLYLKAIFNFIEDESDDGTAVKKLWDLGLPIDRTDSQGVAALHYAVSREKIKKVELLLSYGADINKKTYRGTTPIMVAVSSRESAIVALLVKRGANIHDCDIYGRYPIHIACTSESQRNIQLLIDLGVNVNVIDQLDYTPFSLLRHSSAEQTHIFLKHFAFLTANGVSINSTDLATIQSDGHMSAIYSACLDELRRMKETEFTSGVTYHDLISGKIEKLSILAKNAEFIDQFREDQRNVKGEKFVWSKYSRELNIALRMAEKRRDLLINKETMLKSTFDGDLPQIVLDKIARYLLLDDSLGFKKNFYLSLFYNENGK